MPIPLLPFVARGEFGCVHPKMSLEELQESLGAIPPELVHVSEAFTCVKSGDIELHFEHNELFLIFLHPSSPPDGGRLFWLQDWFLAGDTLLQETEKEMHDRFLAFERVIPVPGQPYLHLRTAGDVEITFPSSEPDAQLSAIQWMPN